MQTEAGQTRRVVCTRTWECCCGWSHKGARSQRALPVGCAETGYPKVATAAVTRLDWQQNDHYQMRILISDKLETSLSQVLLFPIGQMET